MEDLYKEHEAGFHTSEDWGNFKDRCSECYEAFTYWSKVVPTRSLEERNEYALSRLDDVIDINPLE